MDRDFIKKMQQAEQGKEIFKKMFDFNDLSINDTFLLILTDNSECICYGAKYLPDFIRLYHRRNIFVLLDDICYTDIFSKAGGIIKLCKREELKSLAEYFNLFHKKEYDDTRMIFLTERDGYGLFVEELLKRGEFSLEEYVAISLYRLKGMKGE